MRDLLSRLASTWSARSISSCEERAAGMAKVCPTSVAWAVVRSRTSGSSQVSRNATAAMGAATRNTVESDCA